jgi:hypothetical protein
MILQSFSMHTALFRAPVIVHRTVLVWHMLHCSGLWRGWEATIRHLPESLRNLQYPGLVRILSRLPTVKVPIEGK